jgi:hypothetical protein
MRSHWVIYFSLAALALLTLLSCSGGPTSASVDNQTDTIRLNELWAEGQSSLAQLGEQWASEGKAITGDVFSVSTSRFTFVAHDEPLSLKGEPVGGYFDANTRSVHYYRPLMDGAIQHEAGHAILYVLRDSRWRCAFHRGCG